MPDVTRPRHLLLEGTRNLRDIGGYPAADGRRTRWGTLFRSGCPDRLSPAAQAWLVETGLRTVIDLRDPEEVADRPTIFADSLRVRYLHLPLFDGPLPDALPPELEVGYWRILEERQPRVQAVLEALVEPGALPALIHCHAGKDRTGVIVALILAAVGVPHAMVAADYALSATCLGTPYLDETRAWFEFKGWSWQDYGHLAGAPAELMLDLLAELDRRYGSAVGYLTSIGLSLDQLDCLRDLLTESVE